MVTTEHAGVRFGRTTICAVTGDLLDQDVDGIVVAANCRGVMGAASAAGLPGLRSLGGSAIEREAMIAAPLDLGTALVTGAPGLEARGTRAVVHAVVHRALGHPARPEDVRRAVAAAVAAADGHRLRSLALPLIGLDAAGAAPERAVAVLVDELVGCLRRSSLRLDRVVLVCRFADHADIAAAALARARERSWIRVQ